MSKKAFVLDTNVLIHDPLAFMQFQEHDVFIPLTVLEELDGLKMRKESQSAAFEARQAIRALDDIFSQAKDANINTGIPLPTHDGETRGSIFFYNDNALTEDERVIKEKNNDNAIINTAFALKAADNEYDSITLVSRDINMRLKAMAAGFTIVADYKSDQLISDASFMNKGYIKWDRELSVDEALDVTVVGTGKEFSTLEVAYDKLAEQPEFKDRLFTNAYIIDEGNNAVLQINCINPERNTVTLREFNKERFDNNGVWGLKPNNTLQSCTINAFLNNDLPVVTAGGPAGCGKTIIAVAAALNLVLEQKMYKKIIYTRTLKDLEESIGFLPGTETDKLAPWMMALTDSLEVLHKDDESSEGSIQYIIEKANITLNSLNFLRGRSLNDAIVILDEAQNTSPAALKALATRLSSTSRLFILGNIMQIDGKDSTTNAISNAFTYAVENYKHFDGGANVILDKVLRSSLAEFSEKNL